MLDFVTQELVGSEEWRRVLEAYQGPQGQRNQGASPEERWLPRTAGIAGVDPARLSGLHGKLIALGLLKFEISGKTGMQYQLTPSGRKMLEHGLTESAEVESAEAVSGE
jgi:hypothetical protein